MFSGNPKIEQAAKIMSTIEEGKFPLLLNRIAQFLSNGTTLKPFTSIEETKLETSLEIAKADVLTLIDGIIEIFQLCAYYMIKPALLNEQLEHVLALDTKKRDAFVQVWTASAKGIVDNLKQKTYFSQLNHISYSVSVEAASDSALKEKFPKAQLQMGLTAGERPDYINLEFNHEELYDFYKTLEQIQGQLDALR